METSIETNGTDVIIGGRIRLTVDEAARLGSALINLTQSRATTPAKARLVRYNKIESQT
jgi:hypothetical protein